jgi:hypothetical protein
VNMSVIADYRAFRPNAFTASLVSTLWSTDS